MTTTYKRLLGDPWWIEADGTLVLIDDDRNLVRLRPLDAIHLAEWLRKNIDVVIERMPDPDQLHNLDELLAATGHADLAALGSDIGLQLDLDGEKLCLSAPTPGSSSHDNEPLEQIEFPITLEEWKSTLQEIRQMMKS